MAIFIHRIQWKSVGDGPFGSQPLRFDILGIESDRLVQHFPRARGLPEGVPCAGRVEPRLRVRRTEPQRRVEGRDGLLRPTEVEEALALPPVRKVSAGRPSRSNSSDRRTRASAEWLFEAAAA